MHGRREILTKLFSLINSVAYRSFGNSLHSLLPIRFPFLKSSLFQTHLSRPRAKLVFNKFL